MIQFQGATVAGVHWQLGTHQLPRECMPGTVVASRETYIYILERTTPWWCTVRIIVTFDTCCWLQKKLGPNLARNPDILSNCILKHGQITVNQQRTALTGSCSSHCCCRQQAEAAAKEKKANSPRTFCNSSGSLLSLASLKNGDVSFSEICLVGLWACGICHLIGTFGQGSFFPSKTSHACFTTCELFNVARRYLFAKISFWLPYFFLKFWTEERSTRRTYLI